MTQELLKKFRYIECVLLLSGDTRWLPSIAHIIALLEQNAEAHINEVITYYRAMVQPREDFGDFYFHDDIFENRVRKNIILDDMREEIWQLIQSH